MKKFNLLFLFILFVVVGFIKAQNFDRISKKILKCHNYIVSDSEYNVCYYNFRQRTKILKKIHKNQETDTLFLLEIHGDKSDSYLYVTAWNSYDTISYDVENYGKGNITISPKYLTFSKYMYFLVSKWNDFEIRKECKSNSKMIPVRYLFATRIIIDKKKYRISCMYFREFFDIDRDQFPIMY